MCLDYCVAKIYECGIIKIERQPPTRWVADSMGQKIHPATGKFWGGFLMSGLLCCKHWNSLI